MQNEEKKGITVKVRESLHAEAKKYLEENGVTMAEFVESAMQEKLHPKIQENEEKNMENMRTIAVQVEDSLFQRIKEYLQRNHISQKQFVTGLIETELDREQAERQAQEARDRQIGGIDEEQAERPTVDECEGVEGRPEETVETDERDAEELADDNEESECMGMSM